MTPTVATATGTGTMGEQRLVLPAPAPGFYAHHRDRGFVAHLTASDEAFSIVRHLTAQVLTCYWADDTTVNAVQDSAQLVVSELLGNAVRACGDAVPLVVEVYVTDDGQVAVNVHDPKPEQLPRSSGHAPDPMAESGRGLFFVNWFAPGWTVTSAPTGKWIRCCIRSN